LFKLISIDSRLEKEEQGSERYNRVYTRFSKMFTYPTKRMVMKQLTQVQTRMFEYLKGKLAPEILSI
jgi:hypothetical protein